MLCTSQAQVEEGIPIMNCLKRFTNWLNKLKQTKNIIFSQPTGSRMDTTLCTFVTWSGKMVFAVLPNKNICKNVTLKKTASVINF